VEAAAELLGEAAAGWAAGRPKELAAARAVEADTGREYMHAATRHCYYQRAELQLLLRQLRFCAAELGGESTLRSASNACLCCAKFDHGCGRCSCCSMALVAWNQRWCHEAVRLQLWSRAAVLQAQRMPEPKRNPHKYKRKCELLPVCSHIEEAGADGGHRGEILQQHHGGHEGRAVPPRPKVPALRGAPHGLPFWTLLRFLLPAPCSPCMPVPSWLDML